MFRSLLFRLLLSCILITMCYGTWDCGSQQKITQIKEKEGVSETKMKVVWVHIFKQSDKMPHWSTPLFDDAEVVLANNLMLKCQELMANRIAIEAASRKINISNDPTAPPWTDPCLNPTGAKGPDLVIETEYNFDGDKIYDVTSKLRRCSESKNFETFQCKIREKTKWDNMRPLVDSLTCALLRECDLLYEQKAWSIYPRPLIIDSSVSSLQEDLNKIIRPAHIIRALIDKREHPIKEALLETTSNAFLEVDVCQIIYSQEIQITASIMENNGKQLAYKRKSCPLKQVSCTLEEIIEDLSLGLKKQGIIKLKFP